MTSYVEGTDRDNPDIRSDESTKGKGEGATRASEMSWDEFEQFFAQYEKEQLRQFYARIGPEKARILASTQVTGYKTPGSNYRWGTRQKRRT